MSDKKLSVIFEAFRVSCEERKAGRVPEDVIGIAYDEGAAKAYEHAHAVAWIVEHQNDE